MQFRVQTATTSDRIGADKSEKQIPRWVVGRIEGVRLKHFEKQF